MVILWRAISCVDYGIFVARNLDDYGNFVARNLLC
jgi:hypothetical protein